MNSTIKFETEIRLEDKPITIKQEYIHSEEYIDFLKRSDLGKQYPKEDFLNRINTLLQNIQISLVARNEEEKIIGICFGLTDFAYWLFISDLGIDKDYGRKGIGKTLMQTAHQLSGGENKIALFTCANSDAIQFYKKIGLREAKDMMVKANIEWTEFVVGEEFS